MSELEFDPRKGGVVIFTDGSAYTKDRSGGWAFVMVDADHTVVSRSGAESDTTISRMELEAPYEALYWLNIRFSDVPFVAIYSDSQYVVLGVNDRTRKRNKNLDSWERLDEVIGCFEHVEFHHVKGHANHEYNELADRLAGEARRGKQT